MLRSMMKDRITIRLERVEGRGDGSAEVWNALDDKGQDHDQVAAHREETGDGGQ